jgi:malic enzyme
VTLPIGSLNSGSHKDPESRSSIFETRSTQKDKQAGLLPPLSQARQLGRLIGQAVGKQAILDGQAQIADDTELGRELEANIWEPAYLPYAHKG